MQPKTRECLDMIDRHVKRRVSILKNVQQLCGRRKNKFNEFIKTESYRHKIEPEKWKLNFDEVSAIRTAVEHNDLNRVTIFKQTPTQLSEAKNPAGKYTLSKDQEEAVNDVVQGVLKYVMCGRREGSLTLLLGPAGTGKTTCIMEIEHRLAKLEHEGKRISVESTFTASTGVAAAINYGRTIYKAASISWASWKKEKNNVKVERELRENDFYIDAEMKTVDLIIVDEISMIPHRVLVDLDQKLRRLMSSEEPFGGKCILLGGDFLQCKAINVRQLPSLCLDILNGIDNIEPAKNGARLFLKFKRRKLTTQHRITDEIYNSHLMTLRNLKSDRPVPAPLLQEMARLSSEDLVKDPEFFLASTLVTSQYERSIFN